MKFTISRDSLARSLNLVAGVVERRQTLPILSNVLIEQEKDRLSLTGTDLEVELVGRVRTSGAGDPGEAGPLVDVRTSLGYLNSLAGQHSDAGA